MGTKPGTYMSGDRVGWTAVMTRVIIASSEGVTLVLFTPEISLWRIIRILLWGNCIGNVWKFGASNKVINYCVAVGFVD